MKKREKRTFCKEKSGWAFFLSVRPADLPEGETCGGAGCSGCRPTAVAFSLPLPSSAAPLSE